MVINQRSLSDMDKQIIWHPFTQHGLQKDFLPVVKAKNSLLYLENGQTVIDAISSWWVNIHGHCHQEIADVIYHQAKILEQVIFSSFTHSTAINFAQLLITALQNRETQLSRVFYSDNGSTAVEMAMKMAYQFYINQGITTRNRFIALQNSYHGDTLGCMSVSARDSYHQHFSKLLTQVDFISTENILDLKKLLMTKKQQHAAIIIEPMIQAAGGMKTYSKEFLIALSELCQEEKLLLICDEAFTGLYRTGLCFAFEHAQLKPDLLVLSKTLTGGFLSLAVTIATEKIYEAFYSPKIDKAFLQGHSYTGNSLACAAGISSWNILHRDSTQQAITQITKQTQEWINKLAQHKNAINSRCLGTIGAVNIRSLTNFFSEEAYKIREFAINRGVLIRPLGPVLYAVPPYCSTPEEIDKIYSCIEEILTHFEND